MLKPRIAVLVSGGGTNLQALIDARDAGKTHKRRTRARRLRQGGRARAGAGEAGGHRR